MITAIDSNVLIDLLGKETRFTENSIAALDDARMRGALVICPVVAAEIGAHFSSPDALQGTLAAMGVTLGEMSLPALHMAGTAFVRYRHRSSKPKERMLADFLVGAHALQHADALLTRDRGYYRTYFPKLRVIDVSSH